jgi:transposase
VCQIICEQLVHQREKRRTPESRKAVQGKRGQCPKMVSMAEFA